MNEYPGLEKNLHWLLAHSLQAGVLVLLVFCVQWIFRRRLTSRWRFALWWIVLARLLLPFSPESAISLFNVVHSPVPVEAIASFVSAPAIAVPNMEAAQVEMSETRIEVPASTVKPTKQLRDFTLPGLVVLWLAGMAILGGAVGIQFIRFRRKLAKSSPSPNARLQALLNGCRVEFQMTRFVELCETEAVASPALFGMWRPRLLLPRGIGEKFTPGELRYVFLHELAHVKRGDLWLNWLVTVLQIVHWFNPLLWLGFARLRADRELACDELALLRAGDKGGIAYGETVVKLLENLTRMGAAPGLIGILEDKSQMNRRISSIANFRRPGPWSLLAVLLIAVVAVVALTDKLSNKHHDSADSDSDRIDQSGVVTGEGGKPIRAEVFVASAEPKNGTGTLCPSCYADCVKHVRTGSDGSFTIKKLDSLLKFQLLAVAKGYTPKYTAKIDPTRGNPTRIELKPINEANAAPDHLLRGRVLDPKGKPIEGAVVEMNGIEEKEDRTGSNDGIDHLAVTDEKGEFLLTSKRAFVRMSVKVSARLFANKNFNWLEHGNTIHDLALSEGAKLGGRIVYKGKGLSGVSVGIVSAKRETSVFLGHFEVGTDANGGFEFLNLPPDTDFQVYTLMNSMKGYGAIKSRMTHTGKDGESTDIGALSVEPAYRLTGRVVLADGKPLPRKTRVLVSRDQVWDSIQLATDKDGGFTVQGVPAEMVDISVRVPGYRLSAKNGSLEDLNPYRLLGLVGHDINNLTVLLEKGKPVQRDFVEINSGDLDKREQPLRGTEDAADHSQEWNVSGHVLDSETGQPVPNFQATPGQIIPFQRKEWNSSHAAGGLNGAYSVYISKRADEPMVKIDADGYLPASLSVLPTDATNIDFLLKRGIGPKGKVVGIDGKPRANTVVFLLTDSYNQARLDSGGELKPYGHSLAWQKTDASGQFDFKPILDAKFLATADANGFVLEPLEALAKDPVLALQPYAKISGTLNRGRKPVTNETLSLSFTGEMGIGINLNHQIETDASGRFVIEQVPAGNLRVVIRRPLSGTPRAWLNEPLQEMEVKPGQTLSVNLDAGSVPTVGGQSLPEAKIIPGEYIQGEVLTPDGHPASADVALQIAGKQLVLGRGAFADGGLREEGVIVHTGADGKFILPMYDAAMSVVAVNEEGYAQVSLEQLKRTPQITLQKWGRIEATVKLGHRVGSNVDVILEASALPPTGSAVRALQPPALSSFTAKTDSQGRFIMNFVPPGEQILSRRVPTGNQSWTHGQIAVIRVQAGETTVTNIGNTSRTVVGKIDFGKGGAADLNVDSIEIYTPLGIANEKKRPLKADAEKDIYSSEEFLNAVKNRRSYFAKLHPDGSFAAEGVQPGKYDIHLQAQQNGLHQTVIISYNTWRPGMVVPPAKDNDDESPVDWGTITIDGKFTKSQRIAPGK